MENVHRALARNALHAELVSNSLRDDLLDQYHETLDRIREDLQEAFEAHAEDGHWSLPMLRAMRADTKLYEKIRKRLEALGGEMTETLDDYLVAGIEDAYDRKVWELDVDGGKDEVERRQEPKSFWKKLVGIGLLGVGVSRADKIQEHIDELRERLEEKVLNRSFRRGSTLDDTEDLFDRMMVPKRGHGNRITALAQNEFHWSTATGREVGRLDNSTLVEESIWLNLLDGHQICPICEPLHGMPAEPIVDEFGQPPIHTRCRCYIIDRVRRRGGKWSDYAPDTDPYEAIVKKSRHLEIAKREADKMALRAEARLKKRLEKLEAKKRTVVTTFSKKIKSIEPEWKAEKGWDALKEHRSMFKDLRDRESRLKSRFGMAELNTALFRIPEAHSYNSKIILENETILKSGKAGFYRPQKDEIHLYTQLGPDYTSKYHKVRGTLQHEFGHRVYKRMMKESDLGSWINLAQPIMRSKKPAYGDFFYPWMVKKSKGFDEAQQELFAVSYREFLQHPARLRVHYPKIFKFFKEVVFRGIRYTPI